MLLEFPKEVTSFIPPTGLTGWGFRRGEPNRPKKEIFPSLHHFLRILFLVALFRVRAFLLHLSKRLCHVFDLIPNIKAYVDRGALCSRHRDPRPDALIDEHHEYLVLVAKENCAAAAGRSHGANLHFDNGLTHTASLVTRLPAKIRIAFNG